MKGEYLAVVEMSIECDDEGVNIPEHQFVEATLEAALKLGTPEIARISEERNPDLAPPQVVCIIRAIGPKRSGRTCHVCGSEMKIPDWIDQDLLAIYVAWECPDCGAAVEIHHHDAGHATIVDGEFEPVEDADDDSVHIDKDDATGV